MYKRKLLSSHAGVLDSICKALAVQYTALSVCYNSYFVCKEANRLMKTRTVVLAATANVYPLI